MRARTWVPMTLAAVVLLAASASAQPPAPSLDRPDRPPLSAEDEAVLERAEDLAQELQIARLELALAEAKDLDESQIADRAEQMYRLQGEFHALGAKHPRLLLNRWREGVDRGMGRGPGMGRRGMGPAGMGRGPGMGLRGMGPVMGRGRGLGRAHHGAVGPRMGRGRGLGMEPGMRRGHDFGMGQRMGRGFGMGRGMGPGHGMGRGFLPSLGDPVPLRPEAELPPIEPGLEVEAE